MRMQFHLPPHVSFGFVDERAVALDLDADRYLLIAAGESAALASLGSAMPKEVENLPQTAALVRRGLIGRGNGAKVEPVVAEYLRHSALEAALTDGHVPLLEVVRFRASASLYLRLFGLKAALARSRRLRSRYQRRRRKLCAADSAATVAQAYARVRILIPAKRLCVPDSLALARSLWRRGITADVYFGVRLNPFLAHAWVQRGDLLLSDKLNTVGEYTPVFRL